MLKGLGVIVGTRGGMGSLEERELRETILWYGYLMFWVEVGTDLN